MVCKTAELTDRDSDTGKVRIEELKTDGFTVNEQLLYGAPAEAKIEQSFDAEPTVRDTDTPLGLQRLRPNASVIVYITCTVLAPFSLELKTVGVFKIPVILTGDGGVKAMVVAVVKSTLLIA